MSEPDPEIEVPYELRAGVWANHVDVFGDIEEATLDFARLEPRDVSRGVLVSRVTLSPSGILALKANLERFT